MKTNNTKHNSWKPFLLLNSHTLLMVSLGFWFWQPTQALIQYWDHHVFSILNHTLIDSPVAQMFWGLLNHRREVWLNLVLTIGINILIILFAPTQKRTTLLIQFLYFWLFFEIGLWIEDYIIFDYLAIKRASPSLVIPPFVTLSQTLNNTLIIDHSNHSFPSGHAFALIYWMLFTCFAAPRKIVPWIIALAIFLCLPRLFSGAHWITDSLFSALLAFVLFSWAIATPLYPWFLNKMRNLIKKLTNS